MLIRIFLFLIIILLPSVRLLNKIRYSLQRRLRNLFHRRQVLRKRFTVDTARFFNKRRSRHGKKPPHCRLLEKETADFRLRLLGFDFFHGVHQRRKIRNARNIVLPSDHHGNLEINRHHVHAPPMIERLHNIGKENRIPGQTVNVRL